jgi:hypothetical protein
MKLHAIKKNEVEVWVQVSVSGRFTSRERAPNTHCIGRWVGPRASLDSVEGRKIVPPCQGSNPDPSAVQPVARLYWARILNLWSKRYRFRYLSIFTVVTVNTTIFSSVIPRSLVDRYFVFGRICGLYRQGRL